MIDSSKGYHKPRFYYGWIIVIVVALAGFTQSAETYPVLGVFLKPMTKEFGWSRTLIVGAAAAAGVAAMLVSPLAGWVVQRFGARALMSSSVILLGAVILSLRWTTSPVTFYLLFGIGRLMFAAPLQIGASTAAAPARRQGLTQFKVKTFHEQFRTFFEKPFVGCRRVKQIDKTVENPKSQKTL